MAGDEICCDDIESAAANQSRSVEGSPKKKAKKSANCENEHALVIALRRLDPVLQFLTRATGKPTVPLNMLQKALPEDLFPKETALPSILALSQRGVLSLQKCVKRNASFDLSQPLSWDDPVQVGFPPPLDNDASSTEVEMKKAVGTLHGSTKTAAKRRLAALKRSLKADPAKNEHQATDLIAPAQVNVATSEKMFVGNNGRTFEKVCRATGVVHGRHSDAECPDDELPDEERMARNSLDSMFKFTSKAETFEPGKPSNSVECVLPKQVSYAGSNPGRASLFGNLSDSSNAQIPDALFDAFRLERSNAACCSHSLKRRLYAHQADAINATMSGIHTIVCTGTGSGKSLCFLLPVLTAAMGNCPHGVCNGRTRPIHKGTSLLMFPTKALAQDQMAKLSLLLKSHPELERLVHPGILDGDTPHAQRAHVAKNCNIILTNPDTLHAAILPGWKKLYRPILENVKYLVIDEAHMYEGIFGAHVALVLSRLLRLCMVCSLSRESSTGTLPTFVACSATISHPEDHFRLLCPIARDAPIKVVSANDDGSPCAPKHFFVWNPPIMNVNGMSTGQVTVPRRRQKHKEGTKIGQKEALNVVATGSISVEETSFDDNRNGRGLFPQHSTSTEGLLASTAISSHEMKLFRRHAADETALLLARAVSNNIRCIAFCKTRCLVEWVYERTIAALKSDESTQHLALRVESYRGGYTVEARRSIERRLFQNELLGVVGTSALELGVDIGGIDVTLHCGYPTSLSSLLQQSGRAGRGATRLDVPSLAIMICFNSPTEQHIWRHPKSLLTNGVSVQVSLPMNAGLVGSHMLCAAEEYPLTGGYSVCCLAQTSGTETTGREISDWELLGSKAVYLESLEVLLSKGSLIQETVTLCKSGHSQICVHKTHPSLFKAWSQVSLRSIEPINYSIVDLSHPTQAGRTDIVHTDAVMDTIPYSRVFYHAFPGAIITHRGRKYEVQCMTRPPAFVSSKARYRGSCNLGAFSKPTMARYSTRPLSSLLITVVKQMERVDSSNSTPDASSCTPRDGVEQTNIAQESFAGTGVVTVKREVHGYKKLSPVTRDEISRSEITLPPMEFDTFAFWIDTDAPSLSSQLSNYDAGVHALSHALLAVAPLFVPCAGSDIDCDHSYFGCTRVMLFDVRAGGVGTCAQLWKFVFVKDGLLSAAIGLLESCPSCDEDETYDGGCPACLQAGNCLKFNQHLSRSTGLLIAKRMLDRIQQTHLYQSMNKTRSERQGTEVRFDVEGTSKEQASSPRRHARARALRNAKDLESARERQVVVGRPTWPLDNH